MTTDDANQSRKTDGELAEDVSLINESLTNYAIRLSMVTQGHVSAEMDPLLEHDLGNLLQEIGERIALRGKRRREPVAPNENT